jgi:aminoglycoside phosphotransferase (APT) family kinase protein
MARSPLILAALAKDAVPQFDFAQVKHLDSGQSGAFDAALLTAKSGEHFVVRMANSASAGTELEAETRALRALNQVVRLNLPFELSQLVGDTQDADGQRALVFNFVYGNQIEIIAVEPISELTTSIATALAAIHKLPAELVQSAGFPELDTATSLKYRVSELDRAAQTGKVPPVLLQRWETALEDVNLFRYQPTVVHGSINGHSVLELDGKVSGILNWSGLRISDPAEDLSWVLGGAAPELARNLIARYFESRPTADSNIWPRAILFSELELARWLLHGYSQGNQEIIEDAVGMLLVLTEEVETGKAERLHAAPLASSIAQQKRVHELTDGSLKNNELF